MSLYSYMTPIIFAGGNRTFRHHDNKEPSILGKIGSFKDINSRPTSQKKEAGSGKKAFLPKY